MRIYRAISVIKQYPSRSFSRILKELFVSEFREEYARFFPELLTFHIVGNLIYSFSIFFSSHTRYIVHVHYLKFSEALEYSITCHVAHALLTSLGEFDAQVEFVLERNKFTRNSRGCV